MPNGLQQWTDAIRRYAALSPGATMKVHPRSYRLLRNSLDDCPGFSFGAAREDDALAGKNHGFLKAPDGSGVFVLASSKIKPGSFVIDGDDQAVLRIVADLLVGLSDSFGVRLLVGDKLRKAGEGDYTQTCVCIKMDVDKLGHRASSFLSALHDLCFKASDLSGRDIWVSRCNDDCPLRHLEAA